MNIWWIPRVLDPPLGQSSAPEATVVIQTVPPLCPIPCWAASPSFVAGRKWVTVTQIMTHHTAYFQSTPNSTARGITMQPRNPGPTFGFVVRFQTGHVLAHVTLRSRPIGWCGLSWAERKEGGKKKSFSPQQILIFQW